jgi:hypothetical protein
MGMKRRLMGTLTGSGLFLLACAPWASPPPPTAGLGDFVLEAVTQTAPDVVRVKGYFPNGCQVPVTVRPSQTETMLSIAITRDLDPAAICPMVIQPYETEIKLEAPWRSGLANIRVNGIAPPVIAPLK